MPRPVDPVALTALREVECDRLAAEDRWISEGSFVGGNETFFRRADLIVWLDVPWRVASYRILSRHVKLSLARKNRFPGLLQLYRFWRWSSRYYANRNPAGLNPFRCALHERLARRNPRRI
jgi:hypothetical protein